MSITGVDIGSVRRAAEAFVQEADREYYLHGSGQKESLETAAIMERHAEHFTPDALHAVLDAAAATDDEVERRRHRALAQLVGDLCVERELAALGDELGTAQATATVDVDGEEMPFFAASVAVQNEPDRERRRRIEEARLLEVERLNPLRLQLLHRHHQLIEELGQVVGKVGYVDYYSTLKGIDVRALGATMQEFLSRTEETFVASLRPWFEEEIGVPLEEAERHDGSHLFRMRDRDDWFTQEAMLPALRRTLLALGVALDDQPNIHLDTEVRPTKSPRAFCAPVRAPEEVYLVIRPTGGYQDWRALFHEAGHTEHFANVAATRPFEERLLGDNSVTEAFAFTLEHLLLDADFIAEHTTAAGDELGALHRRATIAYLFMLRRYAAKLTYELELHSAGAAGFEAMPERYADWLSRHTHLRYSPQTWLEDVDAGFYSSQYLRAWMLEAQLRERWRSRHGERWWASGEVGAELRSLWSLGQALPAHQLAAELAMPGLGTEALERRIAEGLRAG